MKPIFSQKELEFIKSNYDKYSYKEITNILNSFNEIKKDDKQVRTKAATMGLSKRKYIFNESYFECIDTEDKAYWLGFIYADGYVINNKTGYEVSIELSSKDKYHLETFNQCLNGNFQVTTHVKKSSEFNGYILPEREMAQIRIYSSKMFHDLNKLQITQNKTYKKSYPTVNENLMLHFLRGFLDGDGCITNKVVKFTNANADFLYYIQNFLKEKCNILSSVYKENDTKYQLVCFRQEDKKRFLDMLYMDCNIYLQRKYEIYKQFYNKAV